MEDVRPPIPIDPQGLVALNFLSSIPYFLEPHIDTLIECLPTYQGPDQPPRFEPITSDAYLNWWYKANYDASLQDNLDETAAG